MLFFHFHLSKLKGISLFHPLTSSQLFYHFDWLFLWDVPASTIPTQPSSSAQNLSSPFIISCGQHYPSLHRYSVSTQAPSLFPPLPQFITSPTPGEGPDNSRRTRGKLKDNHILLQNKLKLDVEVWYYGQQTTLVAQLAGVWGLQKLRRGYESYSGVTVVTRVARVTRGVTRVSAGATRVTQGVIRAYAGVARFTRGVTVVSAGVMRVTREGGYRS